MLTQIMQDRLDHYQCKTEQDEENAVKEMMQEICLAGLSRSGFFREAAFQGGTCLRILYGLSRFSEDLDFILREKNLEFEMQPYLKLLKEELESYGFKFEILSRSAADAIVKKAILKSDSWARVLRLSYVRAAKLTPKKVAIKIEIDTNPPAGSHFEDRNLNFPFPISVIAQNLPSLFAGKTHALLCREYTKGRDWYDFLWYMRKKVDVNLVLLKNALIQTGPWKGREEIDLTQAWLKKELTKKIKSIDWKFAREDVSRFIKPFELASLELWSKDFFLEQLDQLA